MLKLLAGLLWAIFPLLLLACFYLRLPVIFYGPAADQGWGILGFIAVLYGSFGLPVPPAIWFFLERSRPALGCLALSVVTACVAVGLLYFDPGSRVADYLSD